MRANKTINAQANIPVKSQEKVLHTARLDAEQKGLSSGDVRPHTLLLYGKLSPSKNSVKFQVNATTSGMHKSEIRLTGNDTFYFRDCSLMLHPVKTRLSNGVVEEMPHHTILYPYPDKNVFNAPATGLLLATEAECLEAVYNAKLGIKTETGHRIEEYHTSVFREVPIIQQAQGGAAVLSATKMPEIDLFSGLVFNGKHDSVITLDLGDSELTAIAGISPTATTFGRSNYAVFVMRGFVVRGGAEAVTR